MSVGDECSGQPSTSKMTQNVEKIPELIHDDCHQTIHELADTAGIIYGVCQEILTENLKMCCNANDQKVVSSAQTCVLSYKRRLTRTQLLSLGS
jgi:hypothetical protein